MQNLQQTVFKTVETKGRTIKGWTVRLALGLALTLSGLSLASVSADSGAATYSFVIGTGDACNLEAMPGPAVAMSATGQMLLLTGAGTLRIHPAGVEGGGCATHIFADGTPFGTGTWEATQLLSFTEYGCEGDICGGQAVIRIDAKNGAGVHLTYATLKVVSQHGNSPAGAVEGIRFAAQGLNFNQTVSGSTLFIRQP